MNNDENQEGNERNHKLAEVLIRRSGRKRSVNNLAKEKVLYFIFNHNQSNKKRKDKFVYRLALYKFDRNNELCNGLMDDLPKLTQTPKFNAFEMH